MTTKRDLAIEILGNYENYGCELRQSVFDKVLAKMQTRRRDALMDCLQYINNKTTGESKRGAAAYCIYVLTDCALPL